MSLPNIMLDSISCPACGTEDPDTTDGLHPFCDSECRRIEDSIQRIQRVADSIDSIRQAQDLVWAISEIHRAWASTKA